ncbi:MAG TPA: mercuric reductase [Thermomicrobiales bacterium]|nr:mercuric reductase [Thermomicrobiales bacterium]
MADTERYDAAIVGAGQAGGPLARALAEAGRKSVLIEREHVGGTCVNEGCTPTKTMLASARVAFLARRAADYGVRTGDVTVDLAAVRGRKREMVDTFRHGSERAVEGVDGLEFLCGEARFVGPKELVVRLREGGERHLAADLVFLDVGARPSRPDLPGIEAIDVLDSTSIMELAEAPKHLLILGGGYIGLEFGQMFCRFGSRVTIIQRGARLLAREDADVADAVAAILREDGIEILLKTSATAVERSKDGGVRLTVRGPEGERDIHGSHLLAAAGRTPNTDTLDLAAAGIATGKGGFVEANERLETTVPGVYALGDVKGGPAFTHIAYDDYRIVRDNLLHDGRRTVGDRPVPYAVFTDPQLGRIGLSEAQARDQGITVRVARMGMDRVARAVEIGEPRGFMKAVVDAETDRILGAAVLGVEGGELMAMLQIAMMGGLSGADLREAVFAHPTLAEAFNNLFASG